MGRINAFHAGIFLLAALLFLHPGSTPAAGTKNEVRDRLKAGEIIVTTKEVPGTSIKRGELQGVVNAPPEIVWRVITDINRYKHFMPRTLNSMAVAAEKLPLILQKKPTRAQEVEQLLGPVPADAAGIRVPGGKYSVYLYSHLDLPWPCSNRWYIIKLQQDETRADQDVYRSSWSLVIGNLEENRGEWVLKPFGSCQTKITYRLLVDPGGGIPKFLVDKGTCASMPEIIAAVRKQADALSKNKK